MKDSPMIPHASKYVMYIYIYISTNKANQKYSHLFLDRLAKRHHEIGFHVLKDARDDRLGERLERVEECRLQVGRVASALREVKWARWGPIGRQ